MANGLWWGAKLAATRRRDADTDARLFDAGWIVVRIWEHASVDDGVMMVEAALEASRQDG